MITHKTKWLLAGLVCLALWPAHAPAQGDPWQSYMDSVSHQVGWDLGLLPEVRY